MVRLSANYTICICIKKLFGWSVYRFDCWNQHTNTRTSISHNCAWQNTFWFYVRDIKQLSENVLNVAKVKKKVMKKRKRVEYTVSKIGLERKDRTIIIFIMVARVFSFDTWNIKNNSDPAEHMEGNYKNRESFIFVHNEIETFEWSMENEFSFAVDYDYHRIHSHCIMMSNIIKFSNWHNKLYLNLDFVVEKPITSTIYGGKSKTSEHNKRCNTHKFCTISMVTM